MAENLCKLCGDRGVQSKLVTRQLNFDEAITVCENNECIYPLVDLSEVCKNLVKRKASDVSNFKRKKRRKGLKEKLQDSSCIKNCEDSFSSFEKILQWKNKSSLCWLDCILSLVVHNRTLVRCLARTEKDTISLLQDLSSSWLNAQSLLAKEKAAAVRILEEVRGRVWDYVQPIMKCVQGVNDSPMAVLPILLRQSSDAEKSLFQHYQWEFNCHVCSYKQIDRSKKCVVTFPNTTSDFSVPNHMFFVRSCYRCGAAGQKSQMVYNKQPECIMLHFSEGLKAQDWLENGFQLGNDQFMVCHLIQYKQNPNHFVFWTREPNGLRWMELDDLKSQVCSWKTSRPFVAPEQTYLVVWERVECRNMEVSHKNVLLDNEAKQLKTNLSVDSHLNLWRSSKGDIVQKKNHSVSVPSDSKGRIKCLTSEIHSDSSCNALTSENSQNSGNSERNSPKGNVLQETKTLKPIPLDSVGMIECLNSEFCDHSGGNRMTNNESNTSSISEPVLQHTWQLPTLKSEQENSIIDKTKTASSRNSLYTPLSLQFPLKCNSDLSPRSNSGSVLKQSGNKLEGDHSETRTNYHSSVSVVESKVCTPDLLAKTRDCIAPKSKSVTRNELQIPNKSLQIIRTENNVATSVQLSPCAAKSIPDINKQSHALEANSSSKAFLLKRKHRASHFEPYIPGKCRSEAESSPNPSTLGAVFKDSNKTKSDSNLQIDNTEEGLKKSSFLSWQEIVEYSHNNKIGYDSQSDSGYSSPPSVSSCGSLTAFSECGVVDVSSSELTCRQEVGESKCNIPNCSIVSSELEDVLIDGLDTILTSTNVPDSTACLGTEQYKGLTADDDNFVLDLVYG